MSLHHEADSLDDLLHEVYEHILRDGNRSDNTRGSSLETIGASLVLKQPLNRVSRSESRHRIVSPLAELCWYLSGSDQLDWISPYLSRYSESAEAGGTIHGAYGPRIFGKDEYDQIANAIARLREKPSSRRVVIQILDKLDMLDTRYADIPCTSTIQFLVRDDVLHAVVSMRSNDAWFGLVHDVFAFTMLQEMVARDLEVGIGTYTHFVASLHLYEDTLEKARNFVNEGLQSTISPMDPMPDGSPWQSIKELLRAEQQARAGIPIADAQLPEDPYWADLARIFFAHHSKQAGRSDEAERINSSIRLQPISELLMRKSTRGRN